MSDSPTRPLTPRQAERRLRCVRAALALAREGGYDAVQMRDVAARAEVALGTLYRYFVSKDHLLAAVLHDGMRLLEHDVQRNPPAGSSAVERYQQVFDRALDSLAARPQVGIALLTGFNSPGAEVAEIQVGAHEIMSQMLASVSSDAEDPIRQTKVIRTLEHVWGSTMTGWMIGWISLEQARAEVADAVSLLLGDR